MSKQNKRQNPSTTNQNPSSSQNKNPNPSTSNQCPNGTSSKKNDQQY
ncbi:hypothetical protein [Candidatus Agathobaculum pullicola]